MPLAPSPIIPTPLSQRSLKAYYHYMGFSKFHLDDFLKAGFRAARTSSVSPTTAHQVKSMGTMLVFLTTPLQNLALQKMLLTNKPKECQSYHPCKMESPILELKATCGVTFILKHSVVISEATCHHQFDKRLLSEKAKAIKKLEQTLPKSLRHFFSDMERAACNYSVLNI